MFVWFYAYSEDSEYDNTNGYTGGSSRAIGDSWYDALSCTVTVAHTDVECVSPWGIGSDLTFFVEAGHQRSATPAEEDTRVVETYISKVTGDWAIADTSEHSFQCFLIARLHQIKKVCFKVLPSEPAIRKSLARTL